MGSINCSYILSVHSIVAFIAGAMWVTVCINRLNKKERSSKPVKDQQQVASAYDEVDILDQKIELEENVAYAPFKRN